MSDWLSYPENYRHQEVQEIQKAVCAGECAAVIGLSGAGKSNLVSFLANRFHLPAGCPSFILIDCNRLSEVTPSLFYRLVIRSVVKILEGEYQHPAYNGEELAQLEGILDRQLQITGKLCLLFDRFDLLAGQTAIYSNLRALRDTFKYHLTFVSFSRTLLDPHSELAELFFGHIIWLGPLSESDARWSITQYASRANLSWENPVIEKMIHITWGYPSLIRAVCEAYTGGCDLELTALQAHPAVQKRMGEFWADEPDPEAIESSRLSGQPLLGAGSTPAINQTDKLSGFNEAILTSKEHLLLTCFLTHVGQVCEKDDLIQAVWSEDLIFEEGIRDDSLAQLVRRLRKKIENDPSSPQRIHTIPGRGYRFTL